MLLIYLKVAWRNLRKNRTTSLVNIGGLSVGMGMAMLIFLWVWDELSFNHYHSNFKQIARVVSVETINGSTSALPFASVPMATALRTEFRDEFKHIALTSETTQQMKLGNNSIEQYGLWAESAFPEMLTLQMRAGDRGALNDPSSILISEACSKALFANRNAIGETLLLNNKTAFKVGGVYENIPESSGFAGTDFLLPWTHPDNPGLQNASDWIDHHFQLYVQLANKTGAVAATARIKDLSKPHIKGAWEELLLQPMDRWRLYDKFEDGGMAGGRLQFVRLFFIIGVFVLLLACINYINLSTARSEKRAREVGIRKVLGSKRSNLVGQFLGESMLLAGMALLVALLVCGLSIGWFNTLSGKQLTVPYTDPWFWLLLLAFCLFTGFIAGSYPAFYLSAFRPSLVLKGSVHGSGRGIMARRGLVILQFSISVILIIGTIVVFRQVVHAKNRPVGYQREGLLTVNMQNAQLRDKAEPLRNELLSTGAIAAMSISSSAPTEVQNSMMGYDWEGRDPNSVPIIGTLFVSREFGNTIGWKILEGRDFSKELSADSGAFILNEAAVKFTGLSNPVGKNIRWHQQDHPIVGVVKDMVMESPYMAVEPVFFTMLANSRMHVINLRINPTVSVHDALASIAPVYKKYNPGSDFHYRFTDESYGRKFAEEERIGKLASVFALFAIFISCLGLYGLSAFVAEQRNKEIGIRKILGASVLNVWQMISKEFLVLVCLSLVISVPVSILCMKNWLQGYAYRTDLSWWIFAGTGLIVLLITLLTVSYHAISAARMNPADSL